MKPIKNTDTVLTLADATHAGTDPMGPQRALLVVYLETGPLARTQFVDLPDGAEVSFGRSRGATVRVDSEKVSRMHARVRRVGSEITVEDLGSRNGTRLNGVRLDASSRIASGDEIGVGPATAVVTVTTRVTRAAPIGTISYLQERLAAEVDRGVRYRRRFALVMLRIAGGPTVADLAIDRVSAALRPMDSLAEYGPDEYAIVLPEVDRDAAHSLVARILEQVRTASDATERAHGRAGIAHFPDHGTEAEELVSRARAALRNTRPGDDKASIAWPPEESPVADQDLVVADPQMERVYALVRKVADHPITVLITGETGVGKEVVAEALHRASKRRQRAFVRLNCASLPETLLESELFGHERGAFTGADRKKTGYFEAADGGTIFLDEIGEISSGLQTKLLRVLEEHSFTRVGGIKEISVDVRVVCATNRDLEAAVQRGDFREDLFFRISAFTIVVPPLRDRLVEVPLLAARFAAQAASDLGVATPTFTPAAEAALSRHAWPGNVRELRNAIERAVVLQSGGLIELEHLPDRVRESGSGGVFTPAALAGSVDIRDHIAEVERATIVAALEECGGNQTRAAQKLGISRRALIYKLEKYGLKDPPRRRTGE